jgi:hypothetical protein
MLRKVKVTLPKAKSGVEARMKDLYTRKDLQKAVELNEFGTQPTEVGRFLSSVPRDQANLEAEGGETAITNFNNDGIPEQYIIKGPRHTSGGVPLNLKEDSFIFSDTRSMKIKDQKILQMFGMSPKSGGYTPAEIAKKYDLNKYKKILLDPNADKLQQETAELMITNYNRKLAQLALLQESKKGFPQGIPQVAVPYIASMQVDPNSILGLNDQGQQEMPAEEDQGEAKYGKNIISKLKNAKERALDFYKATGGTPGLGKRLVKITKLLPKAAGGMSVPPTQGQTFRDWAAQTGIAINDPNYAGLDEYIWDGSKFSPRPGAEQEKKDATKVVTSDKTVTQGSIPKDATKHDESDAKYNPKEVKVGDYVKGKDGKWRKVKGVKGGGLAGGSMSGAQNYKDFFGADIQKDIEAAKKLLEEKSKTPGSGIVKDGKSYVFKGNAQQSLTLPEKELLVKLAGYSGSAGFGAKEFGFDLGKQVEKNKYGFWGIVDPELIEYQYWKSRKENWNKTADEFNNLSPEAKKANRVGYLTKVGYSNDELSKLDLDDPDKLYDNKFVSGWGRKKKKDGTWEGDPKSLVGRVQNSFNQKQFRPFKTDDFLFGWEHADFYKENEPSLDLENVPDDVLAKDEKEKAKDEIRYNSGVEDAPFFMQDVINNTGAAMDYLGIKKYMPWQAVPKTFIPEPVYYDPTRELAANAEIANIGTQGAQLFAGPQAFNARYSQIQGQAAKNAADILAKYNNLNVGVANQYENTRASLLNQDEMNRANAATGLFDKVTIANQMYDNEKNMAKQNMRNAFRDAITNRANAQVINSLYPQYHVDPISGGMMTFMGGKDLDKTATKEDNILKKMTQLRGDFPGWSDETYRKAVSGESDEDSSAEDLYMQQYRNMMKNV